MDKNPIRFSAIMMTVPGLAIVPAWAQTGSDIDRYNYGPHMMWWDGGWTMMLFGPLFMIVLLAALVALTVFLVRWLGGVASAGTTMLPAVKTPTDILKERFAKGEIDKTEFEERSRVLGE